ncbi:calcium-binding protein [Agrobacterium tumefaciens]|uniref:calcium-binding protein n=1 Tax=Agrobacterium tumefaciens TaxID=358 RepID=UPI001F185484
MTSLKPFSDELFLAILSMDAYNRGYNRGVVDGGLGGVGSSIGTATVTLQSDTLTGTPGVDAGFYAIAYKWGTETVISYRGTDNKNILDSENDLWNGWTLGGGYGAGSQATLALDFYKQVMEHSAFDDTGAQPILTGHSLGGGLAGFVSFISGATGVGFDHMPFGEGAMAAIATELARRTGLFDPDIDTVTPELLELMEMHIPSFGSFTGYFVEGEVNVGLRDGSIAMNLFNVLAFITGSPLFSSLGAGIAAGQTGAEQFIPKTMLDTHNWDALPIFDTSRHSQALLVTLKYAQEKSHLAWSSVANDLLTSLFSNEIALAAKFLPEDSGGHYSAADKMLTAIAYSVLDRNSAEDEANFGYVFGNSAIRALFNDADALGSVVASDKKSGLLEASARGISEIIVQFAATLAFDKVNYHNYEGGALQPKDGVVDFLTATGGKTDSLADATILSLNLDQEFWNIGDSSDNPAAVEILGVAKIVNALFSDNRLSSKPVVSEAMEKLYKDGGSASPFSVPKTLTSIQFALADGPLVLTLSDSDDTFDAHHASLFVSGDGSDQIDGSHQNDMIAGADGDDILSGRLGSDILFGGEGSDIVVDSVSERDGETGRQNESDIYIGGDQGEDPLRDFHQWLAGNAETDTVRYTVDDHVGTTVPQIEGVEITDLKLTEIGGVGALEISVKDIKSGATGVDTLIAIEKVQLTDNADRFVLSGEAAYAPIVVDMGAGDNIVDFIDEANPGFPEPWEQGFLFINFSTTRENGEAAGKTLNTIQIDEGLGDQERSTPILLVDGKQLIGGAAFDFDKFDLVGGAVSTFVDILAVPAAPPTMNGESYGISTTDRVEAWLAEHVKQYTGYIAALSGYAGVGSPLFGGIGLAVMMSLMPMMLSDLLILKEAWLDPYVQRIIGTQGELYTLENAEYDLSGRVTTADVTITMNLEQEEEYQIALKGWRQGDFGITIENLSWRNALDSGTNKNGQLDDWDTLSLETIREKLAGLGFKPQEINLSGSGSSPGPGLRGLAASAGGSSSGNSINGGIYRSGNEGINVLTASAGDDVFNGQGGNDTLVGGEGRDTYVFQQGDGNDVIIDTSPEGSIVRFLGGLDPTTMQRALVDNGTGGQDLLITYGQDNSIRIVGWSSLTTEQQSLWLFEGVDADLSSPNSADTQDISVLPDSQGGTAQSHIEGTNGSDELVGIDIAEILDGKDGNDTIDGRGGADRIIGGAGDDLLFGGAGDDRIDGGIGADQIRGGFGNDILVDNDGDDTYIFARGDGRDELLDYNNTGKDTVKFLDIASGEIEVLRHDYNSIILRVRGTDDQIKLINPTNFIDFATVDRFEFSDGVVWNHSDLLERYYSQATTSGNDHIYGSSSAGVLHGGAGNDILEAWGAGETFVWERGGGHDVIQSVLGDAGSDVLVLGPDILPSDVTFLREPHPAGGFTGNLIVQIAGAGGGSVTVAGFFTNSTHQLSKVATSAGAIWTRAEIIQLYLQSQSTPGDNSILGSGGNDVIAGGLGNDRLEGSGGVDTYRFDQNFGQDIVVLDNSQGDRFEFLAHDLSDFTITRNGGNLVLQVTNSTDRLTIENFENLSWAIESFKFKNGLVLDSNTISAIADTTVSATNLITDSSSADLLTGSAGNDRVHAYQGDDTVSAGAGNDFVDGGVGSDVINGDKGNDVLFGGVGNDQLLGGDDNDLIFGGSGNDSLEGGADSDRLFGEAGDDTLMGGQGADELFGGTGNDVLRGNTGNDLLIGGAGNDTYHFVRGDGSDIIDAATDRGAGDIEILEFSGGITASELTFSFDDTNLVIKFGNSPTDKLTIRNFLASGSLAEIRAGTVTLTLSDILSRATGAESVSETVQSDDGGVVYGGLGNDTLVGSLERDLFVYNRGDGADRILDWAGAGTLLLARNDELVLTGGITSDEVVLTRSGETNEDLTISFKNDAGSIVIERQFHAWNYTGGVESIRFEDGTVWSKAEIRNQMLSARSGASDEIIEGTTENDLFLGSAGNDILRGDSGEDRYSLNLGNGHDEIIDSAGSSDTLTFGAGILAKDVTVERVGNSVKLAYSTTDSVTLIDLFASDTSGVDTVQFQDGAVWSRNTIAQKLVESQQTDGNDVIAGTDFAEILSGGKGNDHLAGGAGGDTYLFNLGDGNDVITEVGTSGTDIVKLGGGLHSTNVDVSRSQTDGDAIILDFGNGDRLVLDGHLSGANGIEWVEFADKTIWSKDQLIQKALANSTTTGNDNLIGSAIEDRVEGGHGNDTLNGGGGADVYIVSRGDGVDTINDFGTPNGANVIEFGSGIFARDVDLSRDSTNPNDLVVSIRNSSDQIIVTNHFSNGVIGAIRFKDGVQWTAEQIEAGANNRAPEMTSVLTEKTAEQDASFSFVLPIGLFSDPDAGDHISVVATLSDGSQLPTWLQFDGSRFYGEPDNDDVGTLTITLTAIDKYGDRSGQNFDIEILNVNDAPEVRILPANQVATAGVSFSYQLPNGTFIDPDNEVVGIPVQQVILSAARADGRALPGWLTFNPATGVFSGTPTAVDGGILDVAVTASDGITASTTRFGIAIGTNNTYPTLGSPIASLNATEDLEFVFDIPAGAFNDITPGDRLRYTAEMADGTELPSWLKLDAVTGRFTGAPNNGDVGLFQIRITAIDVGGASVSTTTSLVVGNTNDAPNVVEQLESFYTAEGAPFAYAVPQGIFADIDAGDQLTLEAFQADGSALPEWLQFNPATSSFYGVPDDADVGILSVVVRATDRSGASVDASMYLVIRSVNDAPIVTNTIPDFIVESFSNFEILIPGDSFGDVDSPGLTYSIRLEGDDVLPEWLSFDPVTATLKGRSPLLDITEGNRLYMLEIKATDADGASVSQFVTLTVRGAYPGISLIGTPGDDDLQGTLGPDQIYGHQGNDKLTAGQGNDVLDGGEGDDWLDGGAGRDVLSGGRGNDTLFGGDGEDVYLFGRGDGHDEIYGATDDVDPNDTIRFNANVSPSNVTVGRDGLLAVSNDGLKIITDYTRTSLTLTVSGGGDSITVREQFASNFSTSGSLQSYVVGTVEFSDGSKWTSQELSQRFMQSTSGNDLIEGDFRNNVLLGGAGDDRILGLGGDDYLDGGVDNDDLYGGEGSDTYFFGLGSGQDRIIESIDSSKTYSFDTLRFGTGINVSNIILTRDARNPYEWNSAREAGSLLIQIAGTSDSIRIFGQYAMENGLSAGIDRFEFADGTVLTRQELDLLVNPDAVLRGTDGDDDLNGTTADERLVGGKGDDFLYGNEGNDTYVWNLGDGNDRINENSSSSIDFLELGLGVGPENIRVVRDSFYHAGTHDHIYIQILPTDEVITITGGVGIDVNGTRDFIRPVDEIRFADGTSWTFDDLLAYFLTGTAGDDELIGFDPKSDVLDGGAGNDILRGEGGGDVYVFGRGYGIDTVYDKKSLSYWNYPLEFENYVRFRPSVTLEDIRFSSALEISETGRLETFVILSIQGTGDQLRLLGTGNFIDRLYFEADGSTVSYAGLVQRYFEDNRSAGDDYVIGFGGGVVSTLGGNDTLFGRNDDTLIGGSGNDIYKYYSDLGMITISDEGSTSDNDVLVLDFGGWDDYYDVTEYGRFERAANGQDLYIFRTADGYLVDVLLKGFFLGSDKTVERIQFADGTEWASRNEIISHSVASPASSRLLAGTSGDDTIEGENYVSEELRGGLGGDTLTGGYQGGDVYLWKKGDGNDTIIDSVDRDYADLLKFTDVTSADVSLLVYGNDLRIRINPTGEFITIQDHFDSSNANYQYGIGEILFSDGVLWRRAEIDRRAAYEGTTGTDAISGSLKADTMIGLAGDDVYTVNHVSDVVVEAMNGGQDTVQSSVNYVLADNVEKLVLTGSNSISATGNSVANVLTGNNYSNILRGLAGNDTLDGQGGADTLIGGAGNDIYIVDTAGDEIIEEAGEGTDLVRASASHTLAANVENGELVGSSSINLTGNAQANVLVGNSGNNVLAGLAGADMLDGGLGIDTASYVASASGVSVLLTTGVVAGGDAEGDTLVNIENVTGSSFDDIIEGSSGTNVLVGGAGEDLLSYSNAGAGITINLGSTSAQATGGAGTDTVSGFENVTGSAFNDTLTGTTGSNVLAGGKGSDTLVGKAGNDRYIHRAGDGSDFINDDSSSSADVDVLDLTYLSSNDVVLSRVGQDLTIKINATSEILTVRNQFYSTSANWGIERLEFSDATWDLAMISSRAWFRGTIGADTITGSDADDTIDGGAGNDTLSGGVGHDTYVYSEGYGSDVVNERATGTDVDTLHLIGLNQADIRIERLTSDLTDVAIRILSTGTTVTLDNQFDLEGGVERIVFGDGSSLGGTDWSLDALLRTIAAFYGTETNDTITAGAGLDRLRGLGGDDTLNGGAGADILEGGTGNDLYTVDDIGDLVVELAGEGIDTVQSSVSFTLASEVEKLTLTGSSALNGTGNGLANTIVGNTGNNTLAGLGGGDIIDGGAGTDTVTYAESDAAVSVNLLAGTASGGHAEGDVLSNIENVTGSEFADTITGNTAANVLYGLGGDDLLEGGAGHDTLDGGSGVDVLRGGAGDDTYIVDNIADVVRESAAEGTDLVQAYVSHTLSDNVENLTLLGSLALNGTGNTLANTLRGNDASNDLSGEDGNDSLYGLLGDDLLRGGAGNDLLDGGAGADTMFGGIGNDSYVVDDAGDVVIEALNEGTDSISASISFTLAQNVENLTLTGAGAINGSGNELSNTVTGNSADNILSGFDGNDTFAGGGGNDVLLGGAGNDVLNGGAGADSMAGSAGDDNYVIDNVGDQVIEITGEGIDSVSSSISYRLLENFENLTLTGSSSLNGAGNALNNTITGNSGANLIEGLAGADVLNGGSGIDTVTYISSGSGVSVNLQTGATAGGDAQGDIISNFENLTGSEFADVLTGNTAANVIHGHGGNDVIRTGAGNDLLNGGAGDDILSGGVGSDTFVYSSGDGNDQINDEANDVGDVDTLLLSDLNSSDVTVLRKGTKLEVNVTSTGHLITVEGQWAEPDGYSGIEQIQFADGSVMARSAIMAIEDSSSLDPANIVGTANDDVFESVSGDNTFSGLAGNDLYNYGRGGGHDTILEDQFGGDWDRLAFSNLSTYDIGLSRNGDDLTIWVWDSSAGANDGGSITVRNTLGENSGSGVELFTLVEGTFTKADVQSVLLSQATTVNNDVIEGFRNTGDYLEGGAGSDTFVFKPNFGWDTIGDFVAGEGTDDVLEFRGGVLADFEAVLAAASQVGNDTIINVDGTNGITLANVNLADLHRDDVRFVA